MKFIQQALTLIASFVFVFLWEQTQLAQYTIQIIGALIFLYIITAAKNKWKISSGALVNIFILNSMVLLLIFETGNVNSPLFFLLFFIIFGISFIFDSRLIFLFLGGVILLFLPLSLKENVLPNLLKLGTLGLVSPLAYFFGKIYQNQDNNDEVKQIKEREKDAADTISEDIDEVIEKEKSNLKSEDVEKLNEILEQTEDLREETKK